MDSNAAHLPPWEMPFNQKFCLFVVLNGGINAEAALVNLRLGVSNSVIRTCRGGMAYGSSIDAMNSDPLAHVPPALGASAPSWIIIVQRSSWRDATRYSKSAAKRSNSAKTSAPYASAPPSAARHPGYRAVLPFPCGSIPRLFPTPAPRCRQGPFRYPEENRQPLSGVVPERRHRHRLRHRGVCENFRLIALLRPVICLGLGLRANSDLAFPTIKEVAPTRSMFR